MSRERIVLQGPNGHIVIINPVEPVRPPESVEAFLDRIAARAVSVNPELAGYVRVAVVDVADFPATRRFRNAWRHDGGKIKTDPSAATDMILAEVRAMRDSALRASDDARMRLEDVGTVEEKRTMADYRKSLRDLPAAVAAELSAATVAQLESYKVRIPEMPPSK